MLIPLHVHSYYSFLEGTPSADELVETAKKYSLDSIALTDTNGMYGIIDFAKKAVGAGIKPIYGAYIDDPSDKNIYAVFLARNNEGYAALCRIITTRKLKEDFSLIKLLQEDFPNLFILTSSIELLNGIPSRKNIFAELVLTQSSKKRNRELYEFASEKGIPCAATNPVYFISKEDFELHKVVTAIRTRGTFENVSSGDLADEEFYFKDPSRLAAGLRKLPEILHNTNYIAENCGVDLEMGKFKFPDFHAPEMKDSFSFLWELSFAGLERRYTHVTEKAADRLKYELDTINELHLSDYFLVVWDILKEAKRRRMMTIGRGSAANSLVSYCLGFTEVDPIKHNLYFERFLNKSRSSPPDIDIDFSWKERDELIKYVFERYGYDKVAMISTHVKMKARSAFRETAKAFGLSDREISGMSKFIPWTDARNLPNVAEMFPEARSLKFDVEPWKSIVKTAARLANFPRHLGIHASGIVVSPKPITNYLALEYAKNKGLGLIISQLDMYSIEDMGLVKIDLLSQRSLGVLRDTMTRIAG